ncbi:MAG: hypothetical protein RIC80_01895 [Cyclobacteriaceae bacterium]
MHPVLGQVALFEPGRISDNQAFGIALAPDGNYLLYVKSYGGRDTLKIFQSHKVRGTWQKPEPAFFDVPTENQIDPAFSPDGNTILYNAVTSEESGYDVYTLSRTSTGWEEPQLLPQAVNTTAHEFYATIADSRNIYFVRRMESNDIYVSKWIDNNYQEAVPLASTINTEESESNPYISPEEDYIIFISEREDSFGGPDLYVSFSDGDRWSYPVHLDDRVNTDLNEFCPSVDLANERFFFSRTKVEGEKRIENIYSIPLGQLQLEQLRKKAKW